MNTNTNIKSYYPQLRKKISELELFKSIFDQISDVIILAEKSSGNIIYENALSVNMFNDKEIDDRNLTGYLGNKFWNLLQKSISIKQNGNRITFNYEVEIDTEQKILEVNLDEITFEEKDYILLILHDISYKTAIDKQMRESERNFKNIFNNSSDSVVIFDIETRKIVSVNNEFIKRTGYSRFEATQMTPFDLIIEEDHEKIQQRLLKIVKGESVGSLETEALTKDGKTIFIEISSTPIEYYHRPAVLSMVRDISERKEYDKRLFETMIEAEEEERKRMAEDLHDEIGPLLSTLNMYISALPTIQDTKKKEDFYNKISTIVQETTTNVRQISNALSPHLLSNFGLNAAVSTIVEQTKNVIPIQYHNNIETIRFHSSLEVIYYRIIKELINNTLKHAEAKNIEIELSLHNNFLKLRYEDDGKGFDFHNQITQKKGGIGLFNIVSRIQKIGGKYQFSRKPGKGILFRLDCNISQI